MIVTIAAAVASLSAAAPQVREPLVVIRSWLGYAVGMSMRAVTVLLALLITWGCAMRGPTSRSLQGRWIGETGTQNADTSFEFLGNGRARWTLGTTFELHYEHVPAEPFDLLDLEGFTVGPLAGRVLYCIVAVEGGAMRMDCEPGPPGDDTRRPTAFNPGQTQVFRRTKG